MSAILGALEALDEDARQRVIKYVFERLKLEPSDSSRQSQGERTPATDSAEGDGDLSSTATKWLRRNGLDPSALREVYSFDTPTPELIATKIAGETTKQKLRSVVLLLGAAQYLSKTPGKFSDGSLRETCKHYDAYDQSNFGAYMKSLSSEVSGSKELGFQLTSRGIAAAAALLKQLSGSM